MEDTEIIELYFDREEQAIYQTRIKYGNMLRAIANSILHNDADAQECESDTYVKTWNSIPPQRPSILSAFLSKITRNLSLDRYTYLHAEKRGGGEVPLVLDELAECVPDQEMPETDDELRELLNAFLKDLSTDARNMFMRRYWYCDSVAEVAERYNCSQAKVKMSLLRSRKKLENLLKKAGRLS